MGTAAVGRLQVGLHVQTRLQQGAPEGAPGKEGHGPSCKRLAPRRQPSVNDTMPPRRAIVLSGGGARGAYEVGVLAYILTQLPKQLAVHQKIGLLCGTSVGAIHACFLASGVHRPDCNIGQLLRVWRAFRLEEFLRMGNRDLLLLPRDIRKFFASKDGEQSIFLNSAIFRKIICNDIPWDSFRHNIERGSLSGVTVSATHIATGKTVVFVDTPDGQVPSWTRDARRLALATHIGPTHAIASAAIPLLFPAIKLDGAYFCDGGLRQNTPLSPALRLGADRVLVIPVGHGQEAPEPAAAAVQEVYPSPSVLLGKVFNALLLDHLDYDLAQLRGFNRLLQDGTRTFGDSFVDELHKTSNNIRGAAYRHVDTVVVRPSRDLGEMAADLMDAGVIKLPPLARFLFSRLGARDNGHSDLLSYLLFDGRLSQAFIEL
ncbi:MAG: hypothetical protein EOO40_03765, partial [Deltaproteobacteria bacterium]